LIGSSVPALLPAFSFVCLASSTRHGPLHDQHDRAVLSSLQVSERVLDIFEFTKFTRPEAFGQLLGRVQGNTLIVGKEGNLLEAGFEVVASTVDVTKESKRISER
jgi:hypothetical protein